MQTRACIYLRKMLCLYIYNIKYKNINILILKNLLAKLYIYKKQQAIWYMTVTNSWNYQIVAK